MKPKYSWLSIQSAVTALLLLGIIGGALLYKRSDGRRGLGDNYIPVLKSQQEEVQTAVEETAVIVDKGGTVKMIPVTGREKSPVAPENPNFYPKKK